MSQRLWVGDRVRQAAGGPIMSVKELRGNTARCSWYVTNDGWQQQTFPLDRLVRVGRSRSPDRPVTASGRRRHGRAGKHTPAV